MTPAKAPQGLPERTAEEADPRPTLLLLFPGPVYSLEEYFRARLTALSRFCQGVVLALTEQPTQERLGRFEVKTLRFDPTRKLRTLSRYLWTAWGAARASRLAGRPVDLVVTYDPLKTGLVGWCIARLSGARLAVEVNGDYTAWANYADSPRWSRRAKRAAFMALERFVLRRADGVKLLYAGQVDAFATALRNPVVRVFPNHVDLDGFRDLGETPEVLLVGFPFRVKGVDLLIEAFHRVAPDHPDWHLKILGWYPEPAELLAAAAGHPRIHLHPPVSHREVAEHIGRCGIFVLPSRTEAMGRVLLEAAACGKPRVGAATGGIPGVISHEEDGLLVEPENVPALADALSRLMGDSRLRRRLGAAAATRARVEFHSDSYRARLAEFYQAILTR